jgi:putative transposase
VEGVFCNPLGYGLLLDVLRHYRRQNRFELHAFVFMPDHVHLLITPQSGETLERCIQLIKGGFSFRAKKELGYAHDIWGAGFNEHRIKSPGDYEDHAQYIHQNPVKRGLVKIPEAFEYSSAWPHRKMDPSPFSAEAKAQSA